MKETYEREGLWSQLKTSIILGITIPAIMAGSIYKAENISSLLTNGIQKDNISDPYQKTMSQSSAYIKKDIIDVDKDGTPDITRTLITYPVNENISLERECNYEEIGWFKRNQK